MDWNWFFSSLAQSTAAIVGLFGAFIITKILSNQSRFDARQRQIRDVCSRSENLVDEANDLAIGWYNAKICEWRADVINDRLDENEDLTVEHFAQTLNFSIYQPEAETISFIESAISSHRKRKEKEAAALRERARNSPTGFFAAPMEMKIPKITSPFEIQSVNAEQTRIDAVARKCKQHIRVARDLQDAIAANPEHSTQITYTLILVLLLFYVGVIYPLSFPPTKVDAPLEISFAAVPAALLSFKGALLALVSATFSIAIGMFFYMNVRMKYSKTELESLEHYSTLSSYSPYFQVAEENRTADAES